MTKVEFLKKLFRTDNVKCGDCGQMYWVDGHLVWVDNLKGGRISVKLKPYTTFTGALKVGRELWTNLLRMKYPVDAATKVDVYKCYCARWGSGYAARLRCDKPF